MVNLNKKKFFFKFLYKFFYNKKLFFYIVKKHILIINYHLISNEKYEFEERNELRHSKELFKKHVNILSELLNHIAIKDNQFLIDNYSNKFLITLDDGYFIDENIFKNLGIKPIIFFNYESLIRGFNYPKYLFFMNKHIYTENNIKIIKKNIYQKKNLFFKINEINSDYFYLADHGLIHYNYKNLTKKKINTFAKYFKKKFLKYYNFISFFALPFGNDKKHFNDQTIENLKYNYKYIFLNNNLFNSKNNFDKKVLNRISLPKQVNTKEKLISYINYLYIFNFFKLKIRIISKIF